jgi:ABC-type uncharacterized transport system substrate-binding protein
MPYLDALDIFGAIDAFAAEPNGGLIMIPTSPTAANRTLINRLAMQYRLPTIYPYGEGVAEGGLIAYGSNNVDRFRSASSFVDRILRGSKVNELPIEFPTKFELVINLQTAKALGLTIPDPVGHGRRNDSMRCRPSGGLGLLGGSTVAMTTIRTRSRSPPMRRSLGRCLPRVL